MESLLKDKECGEIYTEGFNCNLSFNCAYCDEESEQIEHFLLHITLFHIVATESEIKKLFNVAFNEYSEPENHNLKEELDRKDILTQETIAEHKLGRVKCGLIIYKTDTLMLTYNCAFCQKEYVKLKSFLYHTLLFHLNNSESVVKTAILSAFEDESDKPNPFSQEDTFDSSGTIKENAEEVPSEQNSILADAYNSLSEFLNCNAPDVAGADSIYNADQILAQEAKIRDEGPEANKSNDAVAKKPKKIIKFYYTCEYCGLRMKKTSEYKDHKNRHLGIKNFNCSDCGKCFVTKTELTVHTRVHKRGEGHKCKKCNEIFINLGDLAAHKITHVGESREHACTICGNSYQTISMLNRHKLKHEQIYSDEFNKSNGSKVRNTENDVKKEKTGESFLTCEYCGMQLNSNYSLRLHLNRHRGIKPYKCNTCDKEFYLLIGLKNHMRTHSNEKPFKCKICEKTFKSSYTLGVHCRNHANERKYHCATCGMRFNNSTTLKAHGAVHTNVHAFDCPHCSRTYKRKITLLQHIDTIHAENKPYDCKICPMRFSKLHLLNTHTRSHNRVGKRLKKEKLSTESKI